MAFDQNLDARIKEILAEKNTDYTFKNMMGGVCFLVDDKMIAGVVKDKLMARIDPEFHPEALKMEGCGEMDFTGRPMKGFVFVENSGIDSDDKLGFWIQKCLDYNPKAKSSKKKKK